MFKKNKDRKSEDPIIEAGFVVDLRGLRGEKEKEAKEKETGKRALGNFFWGVKILRSGLKKSKRGGGKAFTPLLRALKGARWISLFFIRFFWILISRILKFSFKNTLKAFHNSNALVFKKRKKRKNILKAASEKISVRLNKAKNIFFLLAGKRKHLYSLKNVFKDSLSFKKHIKKIKNKNRSKVVLLEKQLERSKLLEEAGKYKRQLTKSILSFIVLALILVIPFKALTYYKSLKLEEIRGNIIHSTQAAAANLRQASASMSELDLDEANGNFLQAGSNFSRARENIQEINGIILKLAKFLPQEEAKLAAVSEHLLDAGEHGSELGNHLTLAFGSILEAGGSEPLLVIDDLQKYGNKAVLDIENLNQTLAKINKKDIPQEYRQQLVMLEKRSEELKEMLKGVVGVTDELKTFLGAKRDKKYLLVFQNNNELRATGGFLGSYALLEVSKGKIKEMEAPEGGTYDLEAGMTDLIRAPEPLHLVDPLWHFWDGNWWPDWPTSARNLMDLYEDSGGETVDGVISFTPAVLQRILAITGPIELEGEYELTIGPDNCEETLRNIIEEEAGHLEPSSVQEREEKDTTNPKKIIGILLDEIITRISDDLDKKKIIALATAANASLEEKHILFYFSDEALQEQVEKRGWSGKIKESKRDYLSVINTNIAGQKSDKKIKQDIFHQAIIEDDGTVIDKVRIERTHTGKKETAYYGARNVNWMRIYVPEGSKLLKAEGFDGRPAEVYFEDPLDDWDTHPVLEKQNRTLNIHESGVSVYNTEVYGKANKTVFGDWMILDPGETKVVELEYELPFKLKKGKVREEESAGLFRGEDLELYPYSIYIQKQAGVKPDSVQVESGIVLPREYSFVWKYPEGLKQQQGSLTQKSGLNTDKYWAVLLKK